MKSISSINSFILLILLISWHTNIVEGKQPYSIREFNECFVIDSVKHVEHVLKIKNEANENLWILFEQNDTISDKTLIYQRFRNRKDGDMGLYQWMVDGNVNWGKPCLDLYTEFFKILPPNESFYIVSDTNHNRLYIELINAMHVLSNTEIRQIFKPLSNIKPTNPPAYQPNILLIR